MTELGPDESEVCQNHPSHLSISKGERGPQILAPGSAEGFYISVILIYATDRVEPE
jgi:hypothetical protein